MVTSVNSSRSTNSVDPKKNSTIHLSKVDPVTTAKVKKTSSSCFKRFFSWIGRCFKHVFCKKDIPALSSSSETTTKVSQLVSRQRKESVDKAKKNHKKSQESEEKPKEDDPKEKKPLTSSSSSDSPVPIHSSSDSSSTSFNFDDIIKRSESTSRKDKTPSREKSEETPPKNPREIKRQERRLKREAERKKRAEEKELKRLEEEKKAKEKTRKESLEFLTEFCKTLDMTKENEGIKGIPNLGNTCYMNSALQTLNIYLENDEDFAGLLRTKLEIRPGETLQEFEKRCLSVWAPLSKDTFFGTNTDEELDDRILFKWSFIAFMQAKTFGNPSVVKEAITKHHSLIFGLKQHRDLRESPFGQKDSADYLTLWHDNLQWLPLQKCDQNFVYYKLNDDGEYEFYKDMVDGAEKATGTLRSVPLSYIQLPLPKPKISRDDQARIDKEIEALKVKTDEKIQLLEETSKEKIAALKEKIKEQKVLVDKAKEEAQIKAKEEEAKAKAEAEAKAAASPDNDNAQVRPRRRIRRLLRIRSGKTQEEIELEKMQKDLKSLEYRLSRKKRAYRNEVTSKKRDLERKALEAVTFDGKDLFDDFFEEEEDMVKVSYFLPKDPAVEIKIADSSEPAKLHPFDNDDKRDYGSQIDNFFKVRVKSSTRENKLGPLLPSSFLIQFKRFETSKKIDNPINLNDIRTINLNEYTVNANADDEALYEINGFIVHHGVMGGGHYVSYIRKNDIWYECSDISAEPIDEADLPIEDAYICSYAKVT